MDLNNTELFGLERDPKVLGKLAAKIAYYNFEGRFITLVMFNTVQAIGLYGFLKHYQESVVVKLGIFFPEHRVAIPQFVIFGEKANEISKTIHWLAKSRYDTNGRFIIICPGTKNQTCDDQIIFHALAQHFILNVVLLTFSNERKPLAYSYKISGRGKCSNTIPDLLDFQTDCFNDKCYKSLFKETLLNMHKCPLAMSTIEQPPFMYLHNRTKKPSGADGDLMKLVVNMLNGTIVWKTPADNIQDIGHYANNNWSGSLGDIYNTRVHASVCSAPLTAYKYGNFQISFEYYSMDIVWAARLPAKRAPWENLLHPLNIQLRYILLFTFVCISLLNSLMKSKISHRIRKTLKIGQPKENFLFYSWVLFLGVPIIRIPIKRSFMIMVYAWIWFCFIMRSAYQAGLVNSLKYPAYEDNLKSFQDVLNEGYPYGGLPSLREFYINEPKIYNNWIRVDLQHLAKTLDEILDGNTDFVVASNKAAIIHHLMKYKGTKQLQIIPQKIVNSPTVIYFKRYSPLTAPLSYALRVAYEGGFIQRIYGRYLHHERDILKRSSNHDSNTLKLEHFAGCFVLLILGQTLAFIYFLVELVCGNLRDERQ